MSKHDRQLGFFGAAGQERIGRQCVAVCGCGGLGNHVIPQLACLGVREIIAIDDEELSETNRNRYILARHTDKAPGTVKVDIAQRCVNDIDKDVVLTPVPFAIRSEQAFAQLRRATAIVGGVDNDGGRLVLMEFACAYSIPYFDLATDIPNDEPLDFGGRLAVVDDRPGCLVCMGLLDLKEAGEDLQSEGARRDRERIYGVPKSELGRSGPSVVSLNGVVAGLGLTELVCHVTGVRPSVQRLFYRGRTGIVTAARSAEEAARECHYCKLIKGRGDDAGVDRYILR